MATKRRKSGNRDAPQTVLAPTTPTPCPTRATPKQRMGFPCLTAIPCPCFRCLVWAPPQASLPASRHASTAADLAQAPPLPHRRARPSRFTVYRLQSGNPSKATPFLVNATPRHEAFPIPPAEGHPRTIPRHWVLQLPNFLI